MGEPTTPLALPFASSVIGQLTGFDRMVFRGYVQSLFGKGAMQAFLSAEGVLMKDFKAYATRASEALKRTAQGTAEQAGRPYIYLEGARTARKGDSKEDLVAEIAERDGVKEGLICVLAAQELCQSFTVRGVGPGRIGVVPHRTKCLHFYYYFMDREFGQMHVRIESWFPFEIQVCVNGREWLARALRAKGVTYEQKDNCLTQVGDLAVAQELCDQLARRDWVAMLNCFAERVNPWLAHLRVNDFGGYYWVAHQMEVATDVMFRSREELERWTPALNDYAIRTFGAEDVLRFLGRMRAGAFKGELQTSLKKRPQGWRIKHWVNGNSIKMYDKWSVLRIETTINNPREFKMLKQVQPQGKPISWRWLPIGKGVANMWRYLEIGKGANGRYLESLSQVVPYGKAVEELDDLCRSKTASGRRIVRLNPISAATAALFGAVFAGEHLIGGFRNRDIMGKLCPERPVDKKARTRQCARVSRQIAQLRGHGLVAKIPKRHRYRITRRGARLMTAALRVRQRDFPSAAAGP